MTQNERAQRLQIEKQAKMACLQFHFYVTFAFERVGLSVVQMVRYLKTSWTISVIAPLNGHFKSELR